MNPANQSDPTFCGFEIEDLDEAVIHAEPSFAALSGGSLFVTGGTGFIGQWLLAVLVRANATRKLGLSITILTRSIAGFSARCPQLASDPAVRCAEGDFCVFEGPFYPCYTRRNRHQRFGGPPSVEADRYDRQRNTPRARVFARGRRRVGASGQFRCNLRTTTGRHSGASRPCGGHAPRRIAGEAAGRTARDLIPH